MSDYNTNYSAIAQYVPKFEKIWEMLSPIHESQVKDNSKTIDALHILLEDQDTAYEGAFILTAFTNWVAYNKIINDTESTMQGALVLGMIQNAQFELRLQSEAKKSERS